MKLACETLVFTRVVGLQLQRYTYLDHLSKQRKIAAIITVEYSESDSIVRGREKVIWAGGLKKVNGAEGRGLWAEKK